MVHGNHGPQPVYRTAPALRERIVQLAGPGGKYHDLNTCHLQELLAREEQIVIGRSTLDRLLKQAGVRKAAPVAAVAHRRRRERRAAEGMLLQIDGSPFAWLEERGAPADLLGAIDDATGQVLFLHFRPSEDQVGYLILLRSIAQRYGLPMSIYHDRHTILRSPKQLTLEEQLAGQPPISQVQRVMAELGIESIAAFSPQAKGRIERLWGTLQDRLTKELLLAGITRLEAANAFLPTFIERYNAHFAHPPQDPQVPGCPYQPISISPTTSRCAKCARCAAITAFVSPVNSYNCYPAPRIPAWLRSASACTRRPKETSMCITANSGSAINPSPHRKPAPPSRAPTHRRPSHRLIPRARPSNGPGSLASTSVGNYAKPPACARLSLPARRIGATLWSDPERRRRAGVAAAGWHHSAAAAPTPCHPLHWPDALNPMCWLPANALKPTPPPTAGLVTLT